MTPQEIARQRAEVMMAFADGAEIERCANQQWPERWTSILGDVDWNWVSYDYRVKPQPKTVTLRSYLMLGGELKTFRAGTEPIWDIQPELIKTETIPLD